MVPIFTAFPPELQVTVLAFKFIVLVFELLEDKLPQVTEQFPVADVSKVPFVIVSALVPQLKALPKVQPPPTPSKFVFNKETPLVVTVLPVVVALNVVVPVQLRVKFVAGNDSDPLTVKPMLVPASVIAPSRPDAVKSLQTLGVVAIVTVKAPVPTFELASKNTLSAAVGTEAPLAPPDDADQFAVLVPSQVPVPPTQ